MLISLHLPKTAGTSFGKSLGDHFGNALLLDYDDNPIAKSIQTRSREAIEASIELADNGLNDYQCVHGHFLPVKYLLLSTKINTRFITWMRDPVERMLSHYYFWQTYYDPEKAAVHHKRFIEEKWSLERFCLGPEFRNIYHQYLWGFPLRSFNFIGISEFYQEDFNYFCSEYFGQELPTYRENITQRPNKIHNIDEELRKKIELYHKDDVEIYQELLKARKNRS